MGVTVRTSLRSLDVFTSLDRYGRLLTGEPVVETDVLDAVARVLATRIAETLMPDTIPVTAPSALDERPAHNPYMTISRSDPCSICHSYCDGDCR